MDKKEILDILDNAKDERGAVPMRLVRQAFDKLPTIQPEKAQLSKEGTTKGATSDTISRQAAIDAVMEYGAIWMEYTDAMDKGEIAQRALNNAKSTMIRILKELPSVQPEPKEGHWIPHETPDGGEQYECSRCGVLWEFNDGTPEDNEAYYCPKCGTKMKGVKHETD